MMQIRSNKLFVAGAIFALLLSAVIIDVAITMNKSLSLEKSMLIDLERGSSIKTLANDLKKKGLIKNTAYLRIWAGLKGITNKLKAGEYRIDSGTSLSGLLENMAGGKVEQYKLTLVEGWTFKEVMDEVNRHPQIVHTLSELPPEKIMGRLGYDEAHPEGRFYPDTYFIHKNTLDTEFLKRSFDKMSKLLETEWQHRDEDLPLKNAYQALTLASIVEKESAIAEERSKIAGVFINRLRKKMRLQTDPTVIYGIGDAYKGDIRFRDLRKDTPYNTYTRHGLPPTPIAMPGLAAIKAVMHPAKVDALYFVAYGDGTGRHHFSNNLHEHEKAVDQYQKHK